jgi:hypothetical protein
MSAPKNTSGRRTDPYALSTVRSRLPRQIMWAVLIGLISVGLAILINH